VVTTPPKGGTTTTLINDAQDRTLEKRQHTAGADSSYDATKFAYTARAVLVARSVLVKENAAALERRVRGEHRQWGQRDAGQQVDHPRESINAGKKDWVMALEP
jgi:hypothetical protein